jgi:hypothetical protein
LTGNKVKGDKEGSTPFPGTKPQFIVEAFLFYNLPGNKKATQLLA